MNAADALEGILNDPRAVATRTDGFYDCSDTDSPCGLSDTFCGHVWNSIHQTDDAVVHVLHGAITMPEPSALSGPAALNLARTLIAAAEVIA
ncbi:hypothetical protein SAMN04488550_1168 [Gordonia malaquae]|uniref:Uncharacterized protein n=1 Tax=Gordonia malaquae NBRC 108250 TaxID=1223542 RepID=M3VC00_GORML|nr:hypothetical protein [Gordonia malaquae]GAC81148.1 hypothetical protein GM1_029_00510 [Gordonia malaquae NBRC 108250]SEC01623.1 hypothetical protein SAMN04488550_1168 [Gordonia malaquae]